MSSSSMNAFYVCRTTQRPGERHRSRWNKAKCVTAKVISVTSAWFSFSRNFFEIYFYIHFSDFSPFQHLVFLGVHFPVTFQYFFPASESPYTYLSCAFFSSVNFLVSFQDFISAFVLSPALSFPLPLIFPCSFPIWLLLLRVKPIIVFFYLYIYIFSWLSD